MIDKIKTIWNALIDNWEVSFVGGGILIASLTASHPLTFIYCAIILIFGIRKDFRNFVAKKKKEMEMFDSRENLIDHVCEGLAPEQKERAMKILNEGIKND